MTDQRTKYYSSKKRNLFVIPLSITQTLKIFMIIKCREIQWGKRVAQASSSQEISYSVSQWRRPLLGDLTRCQETFTASVISLSVSDLLSLSRALPVREHSALKTREWRRGSRLPCTHTSLLSYSAEHSTICIQCFFIRTTLFALFHQWTLNKPWLVVFR